MTSTLSLRGLLAAFACLALMTPMLRAEDDVPSFKQRGDHEKKFVTAVCQAVLKAAHFTGKDPSLEKYTLEEEKKGRHKLTMKGSYKGLATKKQYFADIVLHLDTSDKNAWEVMRIEYSDNNNVPYSRKKVDELLKKFNRK